MSVGKQKKAIILDPCFGRQHGHWENYCKRVYQELARLGYQVLVYGQTDNNPLITANINFIPFFSVSPFENISKRADIDTVADKILAELMCIDVNAINDDDLLLFQSIFPSNFSAILQLMASKLINKNIRSLIFFQFPAADQKNNVSLFKNFLYRARRMLRGQWARLPKFEWCENNLTCAYLGSRSILQKLKSQPMTLVANSENMAKNFSIIFNEKVHSIPMPGPDKDEIEALIGGQANLISKTKHIKVGYFGHASIDKGGHFLESIVRNCLSAKSGVEFHLHLSANHEMESCFSKLLQFQHPSITYYRGHLDKSTLLKLISEVDIILLPYASKKYANCPSAVLMEALILNKVVVVPDESSLAETVTRYNAGYTCFKAFNADAISLALIQAIAQFETLQEKSLTAGQRYYNDNNIRKYTNDFLQVMNHNQAVESAAIQLI